MRPVVLEPCLAVSLASSVQAVRPRTTSLCPVSGSSAIAIEQYRPDWKSRSDLRPTKLLAKYGSEPLPFAFSRERDLLQSISAQGRNALEAGQACRFFEWEWRRQVLQPA